MTKKELIQKAKELGIPNYSKMKKDELSVAVQTVETHEKIHEDFHNLKTEKKETEISLEMPKVKKMTDEMRKNEIKKAKRGFLQVASLTIFAAGVWIVIYAMWPEPSLTEKFLGFFGF